MNCGGFQKRLEEYLDDALSRRARTAAQAHLSVCEACRQALSRREEAARRLSGRLRESAASLRLSPETQDRVLRSVAAQTAPQQRAPGLGWWVARPAWNWAAAAILMVGLLLVLRHFEPSPRTSAHTSRPPKPPHTTVIEASYRVPTCTFVREGGLVRDTLVYKTVLLNTRLSSGRE